MAAKQRNALLHYLRRVAGAPGVRELTDRALLERFASERDEAAFDVLVQRHGPMVWGVCRRVLPQDHDADDAFQATFLVLARKAGSLRWPDSVAGWLHGVAHRIALKARVQAARRGERERRAERAAPPDPMAEISARELQQLLDEELLRLPEKYRAPLILCYLEGKTRDEAAELLGWTAGSVKGRLERGRQLLESRLARRGLAFSTALLATVLTWSSASAAVPAALHTATVQAGAQLAAGPATALHLADGAMRAMLMAKLKTVMAAALLTGAIGLGAGVAVQQTLSNRAAADAGESLRVAETAAVQPTHPVPEEASSTEPETVPQPKKEEDLIPAPRPDADRDGRRADKREAPGRRPPDLSAPVSAVDKANHTITVPLRRREGEPLADETFVVNRDAPIELNDGFGRDGEKLRRGKLGDIAAGVRVDLYLTPDKKTVTHLRAHAPVEQGRLAVLDVAAGTLTVTLRQGEREYLVTRDTRIQVEGRPARDGKPATLADLTPGEPVTLRLRVDRQTATHITQGRKEERRDTR